MLTLLLLLIPVAAALLCLFMPGRAVRMLAFASSLAGLVVAIYAYIQLDPGNGAQFIINVPWVNAMGIRFHIGMDGISLLMILLSNLLMPFVILSSLGENYKNPQVFYFFILLMQGAMNGVFVSMDLFLYYIFWELALVPAYFLVLWWGSGATRRITFKFFIYTLFGSLFMLVAIIWLSWQSGTPSSDIDSVYALNIPANVQTWIFFAFMIAFAIKIPIFPFHTWQPDTYTSAPVPVTMLLAGIMLKMGLYSIIRWVIPIVPDAVDHYRNLVIVLAAAGVFYASAIAWVQKDLKRVFAYASIAHVGLIAAGLFTVSETGLQGGLLQMLAHGINVTGLFYICFVLYRNAGSNDLTSLGGLRNTAPVFAGLFLTVLLAGISLPLTNAFPGEILLLNSVYQYNAWITLLAGSGVILGAVYMLSAYRRIMLGPQTVAAFPEANPLDKWIFIPLVVLIFVFGVAPSLVTHLTEAPVQHIIEQYSAHNNAILK